jgi:hypothetical protein
MQPAFQLQIRLSAGFTVFDGLGPADYLGGPLAPEVLSLMRRRP